MFQFKELNVQHINQILPLIKLVNSNTGEGVLAQRFQEMFSQNYECIGVFDGQKLIGCCGLWYQTRHYSGRSVEPDHVVILPEYRNQNLGEKLIVFCKKRAAEKGYETMELNCYIENIKGQNFWEKMGFQKLGYHSIIPLSGNKKSKS